MAAEGLVGDERDVDHAFEERQVAWSTALQSVMLPEARPYLVGPLARFNLCFDQLPPRARAAAEAARVAWPMTNPFQSIVARAIEVVAACEEAIRIVRSARAAISPCRIPFELREAEGCHATEAPRGLIYHRYRIGADGLVAFGTIVPPTSQNQGQIEADLRDLLPGITGLDDAALTQRCEHMIRNYDPCISCATHFLSLRIERT